MTAILGCLELLLEPDQSEEERALHAEVIHRNGEHLLALLRDVVDFSQLEAGLLELERVPCSPARVITDVSSRLRSRATEKGLGFGVEYRGSIPEEVTTDPGRLGQILEGLLENAIRYTERGEVRVVVWLRAAPDTAEPHLRIEIIDTGPGMPPETKATLFDPFAVSSASEGEPGGSVGLGLPVARRLARLLGGELSAESTPGEGSLFALTIPTGPLDPVQAVDDPRGRVRLKRSPPAPDALGRRVLIVEDSVGTRELLARWLRGAGLQIELAENGRVAVDKALEALSAEAPFDLILMDLEMPELDGASATAQLRSAGYIGPVIALTANTSQRERERCLSAGCDEFATKPIDRTRLLDLISRRMGG